MKAYTKNLNIIWRAMNLYGSWLIFLCCIFGLDNVFAESNYVNVITYSGVINPISARYINRCIAISEKDKAQCLILQLDTPGGLDKSMRDIVQHIMNSNVPVVVYIYPNGARAASAGVFIALAADIVAMSPGTNIGAAHPVDLSGKSASEKITNDAVAYIKAIAQKKHRNISWAEKAVKESVSITETEAVKLKISDWTSSSIDELLTKINGKKIILSNNETKIIDTKGSRIRHIKMNNIEKFLNAISDPNIAYVLFMLGIYGLIYELASPGTLFSGIVGVICIILALTAFESLPINLAGLLLILLAILLFFLDIKAPTHGILTIGGIIALTLGSFMLFVPSLPEYRVSTSIVVTMVILTSGFFTFAIAKGILAQKSKVMSGWESLIGKEGDARSDIAPEGRVYVAGEEWTAYIEGGTITKGEKIKVIGINGVKLKVEKAG